MVTFKEKATHVNFLAIDKQTGQPTEMETEVDYLPNVTTDRAKARLIGKVNSKLPENYECIYIQSTEPRIRTYEMSEDKFKELADLVPEAFTSIEGGND